MKKLLIITIFTFLFFHISTQKSQASCSFNATCLPVGNQFFCSQGTQAGLCCNNPLTDCVPANNGGNTGATGGNMDIDLVDPNSQYATLNNLKPSGLYAGGVNLLFGAAGIVAFIYLLWGGYTWITSGGDKEGMDKARKRITSALIGLALVFSVYALVFIIRALFGLNTIQLNISPLNVK